MGFYYLYLISKDYQKNENEDKKDEELKNHKEEIQKTKYLDYKSVNHKIQPWKDVEIEKEKQMMPHYNEYMKITLNHWER